MLQVLPATFTLSDWFDLSKRINDTDVETATTQMLLYAYKDDLAISEKEVINATARMRAAVNIHNAAFPAPPKRPMKLRESSAASAIVSESIFLELISIASKKEKAKAKRKANSENISEKDALHAIFLKATGSYPLEKFIAQRKVQIEKQKVQTEQQKKHASHTWRGWFDGAAAPSNPGQKGVGALLVSPSGERFEASYATGFGTNNEAEYEALIAIFNLAVEHQVKDLVVFGDSQLVVNQVNGQWECRAQTLYGLMCSAKSLRNKIERCDLRWIPREQNGSADALSKKALGMAVGDDAKTTRHKGPPAWGSQTNIGEKMRLSAIAVGKLLDAAGLRDGKLASKKALDAGLAKNSDGRYGVKIQWNVHMVVKAIKDSQDSQTEEDTQSAENVLRRT